MSREADWIQMVVEETRNAHKSVTEAAASRIEELLRTQLSHSQIPAAQLKWLATTLISDMVPQQPETENKGED